MFADKSKRFDLIHAVLINEQPRLDEFHLVLLITWINRLFCLIERKHSGLGIPSQNGSHGKKEESRLRALNRQAVRLFTIMFDNHDCAYRGWQQYH